MARSKKQHLDIGKYVARYEHIEGDDSEAPRTYSSPADALETEKHEWSEGDVLYVYEVVDVRVVRKTTIAEKYIP